uniref:Uncharacterized protein n=1 Tax=Oryza brachyantha TaxID=4533 RepID=J3LTP2_ORYBR
MGRMSRGVKPRWRSPLYGLDGPDPAFLSRPTRSPTRVSSSPSSLSSLSLSRRGRIPNSIASRSERELLPPFPLHAPASRSFLSYPRESEALPGGAPGPAPPPPPRRCRGVLSLPESVLRCELGVRSCRGRLPRDLAFSSSSG